MAYGTIKVDTITFTDAGVDKSVTISGLVQNPTFSGNITVTGTVSGNTIQGQTVSGATITGGAAAFTTVTGGVATITSGVFALGSASNPSISFNGDANSGLYSPGADQVAVSTGGTGRLFVDASGNVGVGTSSVNALLEVNNSTAGGEVQRIEGNYDGSGSVILTNWRRAGGSVAAALKYNDDSSPLCMSIGTTTSHEFRIRTADTDAITIDASQRVGIGTSAPQATLHANGAILSSGALVALSASNIFFDQPTSALSRIGVVGANTSTAGALRISQYSSDGSVGRDVFSIDDQGRVGIGTTSPAAPLDVNGAIYSRSTGVYTDAITAYGGSSLAVNAGSSNLNITVNASERARIDSSGRLLVGTSSTRTWGGVTGQFLFEGTGFSTSPFFISNSNDQYGCFLTLGKSRGTSVGSNTVVQSGDYLGEISFVGADGSVLRQGAGIAAWVDGTPGANDMPGRLIFATTADGAASPTERMRITSGGNVGIGTTSPGAPLEVIGTAGTISARATTGVSSQTLQIYNNGTDSYIDSTAYGAGSGGGIVFRRNGSGEMGRWDTSGRLLVGTSTSRAVQDFTGNGPESLIQIEATNSNAIMSIISAGTADAGRAGTLSLGRHRNATVGGTPTIVQSGDTIGAICFAGGDGTDMLTKGAAIACQVDGTPGADDMPGRLVFSTTADGASSPTERLRIDSAGNVGIGTSSPQSILHLSSTGPIITLTRNNNADAGSGAINFATSDNTVRWQVGTNQAVGAGFEINRGANTNNAVYIDTSNRVGIGTTSPSSLLELSGVANPQITLDGTTTTGQRGLIFAYNGTGYGQIGQNVSTGELRIRSGESGQTGYFINFSVNGSDAARIDSSGRLGIGTSSPQEKFVVSNGGAEGVEIACAVASNTNVIQNYNRSTSTYSRLRFDAADYVFRIGTSSKVTIDSAGNVGIGIASPAKKLDVYEGSTGNVEQYLRNTTINLLSKIDGTTGAQFGTETSHPLVLLTGNSERARIDSSGRLLVGTSSARSNVYRGASSLISPVQIDSNANSYSNGINVLNYSGSGYGSVLTLGMSLSNTQGTNTVVRNNDELGYLNFVGNDGTNFRTGAWIGGEVDGTPGAGDMPGRLVFSTTADGAASPTERMRIGADGLIQAYGLGNSIIAASAQAAGTIFATIICRHSASSTTTGTTSFQVMTNGDAQNTNNSYGAISDIKLKENIVDANSQWDDLKALQVRNYNFKEGQTHTQIGLVAQEVELVSPGLVSESPDRDEDGNDLGTVTKSVNYSVLYMKAVKALQEAMERIETLEAKVAALESA
jgi:hypothetical protein